MVHPDACRRAVATCLLRSAIETMPESTPTRLRSHAHFTNTASMAWCERVGFVEVPTWNSTAARQQHARWMAGHHDAAGHLEAARVAREEENHWDAEFERVAPEWMKRNNRGLAPSS